MNRAVLLSAVTGYKFLGGIIGQVRTCSVKNMIWIDQSHFIFPSIYVELMPLFSPNVAWMSYILTNI